MKKHKNVKSIFSYLYNRTVIVGISICIQAVVLVMMLARFSHYFPILYATSILLSIGAVLWLVNNRANPAYKIVWILVIMAFPVFGGIFYLMFSGKQLSRHQRKKMQSIYNKVTQYGTFQQRQDLENQLQQDSLTAFRQSRYITNAAITPVYQNTSGEYFPLGEDKFARMLEELEKAEHFIFMEYFIIQEGKMWNAIFDILKRKAAQGLDAVEYRKFKRLHESASFYFRYRPRQ